ncbi:MAG: TRAP transporter small permease [Chloroflexota bacterium]
MKLVKLCNTLFDNLLNFFIVLSIITLIFSTLSVCAEVVMRYFLNRPIIWVVEVSEWILLFITFLGAAWVLKKEGHIAMDLLTVRLHPRASALLNSVTSLICAVTCLILTWYGAATTLDTFERGVLTYSRMELPIYPITAVIALGSLLLFIQFMRRSYGYLEKARLAPGAQE